MDKKRLSVFLHGGVGGGFFSQGQPNIAALVQALANDYSLCVYSQYPANADYSPSGFDFVSAPRYLTFGSLKWLWIVCQFWRDHKKLKYDLVYAFWAFPAGVWAVVAGKMLNVPSLLHLQGGEVAQLPRINYGALRNPLKRKLIKWALNHANAVVALTEFQKQQMKKLADVPCVVIPFGVDENQFVFQQKKLQGIRKFLHVGSLIPVKDQLTLLRCFSLYHQQKPAVLRMVGEGYLESYLKKVCEELKIKDAVFFEGFHRHTELYPFFAEADILLHTAVYEGQCLAVTEALASGVLVAGTQVGLIADQGDRCCITVDVGDAAGLAQKLLSLRDEEFHAKVTEAKRWSEAHTFSKMVSKIKDTIHLQLGGEEK